MFVLADHKAFWNIKLLLICSYLWCWQDWSANIDLFKNKGKWTPQQQNPTPSSSVNSFNPLWGENHWLPDNIKEVREWIEAQVQTDIKSLGYFSLALKILAGPDQTGQGQLLVLVPLITLEYKHIFCGELSCKITKNLLSLHHCTLLTCSAGVRRSSGRRDGDGERVCH